MAQLLRACSTSDIEEEDVRRFDHEGRTHAIYHGPNEDFFATDGYCTHEKAHLGDGLVDDYEIECPLRFGAFDYRTGEPTGASACVRLMTYPVTVEEGAVFIDIS
jgi:3-phenylpropionate/trans-cinnamate dioxygenase ferredoxin subunit